VRTISRAHGHRIAMTVVAVMGFVVLYEATIHDRIWREVAAADPALLPVGSAK
jgi:hypothetical protein